MELYFLPKLELIFVQLLWTDSMIAALGFPERFSIICFFVELIGPRLVCDVLGLCDFHNFTDWWLPLNGGGDVGLLQRP